MAWHGMAWHGMAWHGMIWYGMVWYMPWINTKYDIFRLLISPTMRNIFEVIPLSQRIT